MRYVFIIIAFQSALLAQVKRISPCSQALSGVRTFAAVYFDDDSLNDLSQFDMAILDPSNYDSMDVVALKAKGCKPLAYLNIGEVETYRDYFDLVDTSILLGPDSRWRDRFYVDMCDPQWQEIVMKARLPDVIAKGFCGIFLDLSDLLSEFPETNDCAVALIKKIHKISPSSILVLDGGLPILEKVGNDIDGIAVEGMRGFYDFDSDDYEVNPDSVVVREAQKLQAEAKTFKLTVFQLDYASPADVGLRRDIIQESRKLGFVPYVGTIELDTLFTDTLQRLKAADPRNEQPAHRP